MDRLQKTALGFAASAAILSALPAASFAAAHGHAAKTAQHAKVQQGLLLGSLSALSSSSVSVTAPGGATTAVSVGSYTRYVGHTQAAAIAGLKIGEQVAVRTVTTTAGTRAGMVEYDTVAFGVPIKLAGTITGGSSSSLTLTLASGSSITVQLTGTTKYVVNGTKVSSLSSIPVNSPAVVAALQMTNGGTVAATVVIGQTVAKGQRVVVHGTITSVNGTTLTVTARKGATPVQVQLATTTRYIVAGKLATTAPTFTANQRVVIIATRQADGSLVAATVAIH